MRIRLIPLMLLAAVLYAISATGCVYAYTYETMHFVVYYDDVLQADYAKSVGDNLEYYYGLYVSEGLSLAPPCDVKYVVYIKSLKRPYLGFTSWIYRYNPSTGEITYVCITNITITIGLKGDEIRYVAAHELTHVAQASYLRNAKVAYGYTNGPPYGTWYWEGIAEANAMKHVGCIFDTYAYYFYDMMYMKNPYGQNPEELDTYSYSTFFMWLFKRYSVIDVMKFVFSRSSTVINDWLNDMYVEFLKQLVHGIRICGSYFEPRFMIIRLSEGVTTSYKFDLPGLSAIYVKVVLPRPGIITIFVDNPSITSNFVLNKAIPVKNTTLYIAFINAKLKETSFNLHISYRPYLSVKVKHAVYNFTSGVLYVTLKVESPLGIDRLYVNGTPYHVYNGLVDLSIKAKMPSVTTFVVSYGDFKDVVKLRIGPIGPYWTPPYVPVAPNSTISFKIQFRNYGDVPVICPLSAFNAKALQHDVKVEPGLSDVRVLIDVSKPLKAINLSICGFDLVIKARVINAKVESLKADLERGVLEALIYIDGIPIKTSFKTREYPSEIPLKVEYPYAELTIRLKTPLVKAEAFVDRQYVTIPSLTHITVKVVVPNNVELQTRLVVGEILNRSIHLVGGGIYEYRISYPVLAPGAYNVSILIKGLLKEDLTIYGLLIRRFVVLTPDLVNVGDEADIYVYADYAPFIEVPISVKLRGCFNTSYESVIRPGKAIVFRLKSNRTCVLRLTVDLAGVIRKAVVTWSRLIVKCRYKLIDVVRGTPLLPHNACFTCIVILAHNNTLIENPSLEYARSNLRIAIKSPLMICINGVGPGYLDVGYKHLSLKGSWGLKFIAVSENVEYAYGLLGELPRELAYKARKAFSAAFLNGDLKLADEIAKAVMLVAGVPKWDFLGLVVRHIAISRLENDDLKGFVTYASYLRYTPYASILTALMAVSGVAYALSKTRRRSMT